MVASICSQRAIATGRQGWLMLGAVAAMLAFAAMARAEDDPSFRIEFNDGMLTPQRLEVPAKKRFKLELRSAGKQAAEFESKALRREKVLAPGTTTSVTIRALEAGEYDLFDDFHRNGPPGVLVAK